MYSEASRSRSSGLKKTLFGFLENYFTISITFSGRPWLLSFSGTMGTKNSTGISRIFDNACLRKVRFLASPVGKKLIPFCFRDGLLQEADGVFCGSADVSGKSSLSKSAGERAFFPAMQQLSCVFIFNISQTTFRALELSSSLSLSLSFRARA